MQSSDKLAYLQSTTDGEGNATGEFKCSFCGEKIIPDQGRLDEAFRQHRDQCHSAATSANYDLKE
jgi:hypothetical protein